MNDAQFVCLVTILVKHKVFRILISLNYVGLFDTLVNSLMINAQLLGYTSRTVMFEGSLFVETFQAYIV